MLPKSKLSDWREQKKSMIIKFFYKHGPYPLGALSTTRCPGVGSHYRKNTGLVFWARTRPNKSFCCLPLLSCKSPFSESRRGGLRVAEGWEAWGTEPEELSFFLLAQTKACGHQRCSAYLNGAWGSQHTHTYMGSLPQGRQCSVIMGLLPGDTRSAWAPYRSVTPSV